jgi:phytoene dehydrogenase-like protein
MHAMTLYTICPDRLKEGDWEECKEEYANRLIACAERHIPGLRDSIKVRAVLTPADFRRRCHTNHHAFGGIAPFMGTPRVAHQTPIQGLWFVGAQSESGGGVSSVIPAAYKVAQKIIGMTA